MRNENGVDQRPGIEARRGLQQSEQTPAHRLRLQKPELM